MKKFRFANLAGAALLLLCVHSVQAGTVNIAGYGDGSIVQSVLGVWSFSGEISFSEPGEYNFQLIDLSVGVAFDSLSALISTTAEEVVSVSFVEGVATGPRRLTFDVVEGGEYWLSILAITDASVNTGVFGLEVTPVPVPPAFAFMLTSLLGLAAYARQRKAVKVTAAMPAAA